jgi:hypothetical protein
MREETDFRFFLFGAAFFGADFFFLFALADVFFECPFFLDRFFDLLEEGLFAVRPRVLRFAIGNTPRLTI